MVHNNKGRFRDRFRNKIDYLGEKKVCQERNTTMIILKKGHKLVFTHGSTFWLVTNLHINHFNNLHSSQATFHSKQFATSLKRDSLKEFQVVKTFYNFN